MSEAVRKMFGSIAARYDLANDVLSFGIHRLWRNKAVRTLDLKANSTVLDLCTGTGDVAFEIEKQYGDRVKILAVDFVPEMLVLAEQKAVERQSKRIEFRQGDAMHLGLADASLQGATISFGIRNVDDPLVCLQGLNRAMDTGAKLAILEFGQPESKIFGTIYWTYARYLLPRIGSLLTGNREAYEYLPRTSQAFPCGKAFLALLREAGFREEKSTPLFGGIAYLYTASVPSK